MRNRYLLGAGVALAVTFGCAQANAQMYPSGAGAFYFGGEGGWTDLTNQTDKLTVTPTQLNPGGNFNINTRYNSGYNVGARAGYQWGPWRFEEEYSYHRSGLQNVTLGGFTTGVNLKGNRSTNAIMTNVIYDFTFGWPITPHIGGGIGAVNISDNLTAGPNQLGLGTLLHSNEWTFGYQAIAGIEYNINPSLAFDLDYRYFATINDSTFKNHAPGSPQLVVPSYKTGYGSNNVVASLIVRFGPPPPPPPVAPPAAAPAPPPPPPNQVYLVFFDWDRYNITPEGMQIIHQAADHWHSGGRVRIEVTGYTDLSGSAGYNQRLSERRAAAVAKALASFGVPRNEMAVRGLGERNPRVPTANGVREPQNRRVEIVFP